MKIFYDCTFLRNKHTGVDVAFLSLVYDILELDAENSYLILVDTRYDTTYLLNKLKNYANYRIIKIYSPLPLQVFYSAFLIPFYLNFKKIDVYHNPYFFGPLLKFICSSTRIIITVHDMYHRTIPEMMNPKLNKVFNFFADNAIKLADNVIVISNQTKADVVKYLKVPENRLNLISQSLDSKYDDIDFIDDSYKKFGLEKDKYILTVGKILPSKGIEDLIKAYAIMQNKYKIDDVKLVSAGIHVSGYINQVKQLIKNTAIEESLIKLLGYVSDRELNSLYANANLIVVPSHYEGFGLPVLEGMKYKKPVIARKTSSLIEVMGDAGLLFDTTDELAEYMYKLSVDLGLRSKLEIRAVDRLNFFSREKRAQKTLSLYTLKNSPDDI